MMKNYLRKTINSVKRALEGETFNAQKANVIAQIAKVRKTRERYLELNKKADELCKEIKVKWFEKIEKAAKAGKIGVTLKKPITNMLNSEPVYAKLERKFKKLGYTVERDEDGFSIRWGE